MGSYKPPILMQLPNLNVIELQPGLVLKVYGAWKRPNLSLTTLAPGRPRAKVGEPVQSGGFGAVYKVVYDQLKNEVEGPNGEKREVSAEFAAKVVWKDKNMKGKMMDQDERKYMKLNVLREAKNLMEMSREHRHILTCYGVFENNDYWVLVTEYAQLGDLYDYYLDLDEYGHRGYLIGELMPLHFRQVCKAIAFLHEKKLMHRDIKLENFLLCLRGDPQKEVVVLGDLAFLVKMKRFRVGAKDVYGATDKYGSSWYTAPEMLLHPDKPYTEAVDMWSLGANMYIFPSTDFLHRHVAMELGEDPDKYAPQEAAYQVVQSHKKSDNRSRGLIDKLLGIKVDETDPEGPSWVEEMAPDAIDFMRKCLEPDPIKRMTAKEALAHPWLDIKGEQEGVVWNHNAKKKFQRLVKAVVADPKRSEKLQSPSRSESRRQSHGSTSNGTDKQPQGQPKNVVIQHHTPSQASTNRTQSRSQSNSEAHGAARNPSARKGQITPVARIPTKVLNEAKANRTESSASARKDKAAPVARTSSTARSKAKGNATARELGAGKDQTGQVRHRVGSSSASKASPGGMEEGAEGVRSRHTSRVAKRL